MQKQDQAFLTDPRIVVTDGSQFKLDNYSCDYRGDINSEEEAEERLKDANERMFELQRKLYATDNHSILLVFQAMDAAGKDSTIRAVFQWDQSNRISGEQFKAPSSKELDHDFLWRCNMALPERGRIGIFNRSHYEEVLVCKVHPEYVLGQRLPAVKSLDDLDDAFWKDRYESIADWEKHLTRSGTVILKFFLNVSRDEQKRRFMSRIEEEKKNWKFNIGDLAERALWSKYMTAYEEAISHSAKPHAPWFVIPADNKDVMRAMVAEIVADALENLNLSYPKVGQKELDEMKEANEILKNEE